MGGESKQVLFFLEEKVGNNNIKYRIKEQEVRTGVVSVVSISKEEREEKQLLLIAT